MERLIVDGRVSDIAAGAPVPLQWTEGYAVLPAFGRRAHWFKRDAPRAVSIDGVPMLITPVAAACGHTRFEVGAVGLMQPGRVRSVSALRGGARREGMSFTIHLGENVIYTKDGGAPLHPKQTVLLYEGLFTLPDHCEETVGSERLLRSWRIPTHGGHYLLREFLPSSAKGWPW
ncbi:hypothetical protein [Trinickia mobilis]|uniref:hypothetical protein n=1 Tax=Trinickia mobilis TaxID=2816356 RepID=UPI001A8DD691|nr:hypothetical protein [Trinickia mobilis]